MDANEQDELRRLLDSGLSRESIAKALGVSVRTVRRRIDRLHERENRSSPAPMGLREQAIDTLRRGLDEGNITAARAVLDELRHETEQNEYAEHRNRTAAAWTRAKAAELAQWIAPKLDDDPELARLYRSAGATTSSQRDREALVEALINRGALELIEEST